MEEALLNVMEAARDAEDMLAMRKAARECRNPQAELMTRSPGAVFNGLAFTLMPCPPGRRWRRRR